MFSQLREEIRQELGQDKCYICEKKRDIMTLHHVIPLSMGGTNLVENMVLLCIPCHERLHKYSKINPTQDYLLKRLERLKNEKKKTN